MDIAIAFVVASGWRGFVKWPTSAAGNIPMKTHQLATIAVLTICLIAVGCGRVGRSAAGTDIGGREVRAVMDGNLKIEAVDDVAEIRFSGGKVVVGKDRVTLNDTELGKLPEGSKSVEIDYTAGKLTVKADGKTIASTQVGK